MKFLILSTAIALAAITADKCSPPAANKTAGTGKFKGKLETKALCMNYTLRLLEGDIDTSMIVGSWTDETTGKTFKNAFALGSPCSFPTSINEGDEFYFVLDSTTIQNCAVCMAYYPTPPKKLRIKVVEK